MNLRYRFHRFMAPDGDGTPGGGAVPTPAPAPAGAASPASAPVAVTPAAPTSPAPPQDWRDDWRNKMAGGDEKKQARLARYGSPVDVGHALIEAQDRINRGELKPVLGKDASPEELATWRQAHGIPEAADKYDLTGDLGNGFKFNEKDKPIVEKILGAAHGTNQTPEQARAMVRTLYEILDAAESRNVQRDRDEESKGMTALREEWGKEYQTNSNLVANLLSGAAGGLQEQLMNGRLADGTLIKNSPAMQKMLLNLALIQNPLGTVVPGGGNPAQGIREELSRIQKVRSENRNAYNKDTAMQERERQLISAAISARIMDERGNWIQAA